MHEFMLKAVAEAEKNIISKDGGPFGAVIVKDGVIVGTGHNEVLKNNDPTCHAEMQAIRDACRNLKTFDLTGCELYTSCYPCPMCLSATIWANIKKVYLQSRQKKLFIKLTVFYAHSILDRGQRRSALSAVFNY